MTPEVKRNALNAIWDCLQTMGAVSCENGCRKKLLGRHLEHPERSPIIVTTIQLEFSRKPGGFSLWQEGGGLKAIIWAPGITRDPEARQEVDALRAKLSSVLHLSETQLRAKEPHEWLAHKGWPLIENGCAK